MKTTENYDSICNTFLVKVVILHLVFTKNLAIIILSTCKRFPGKIPSGLILEAHGGRNFNDPIITLHNKLKHGKKDSNFS